MSEAVMSLEDMRGITKFRLDILFFLLDRYVRQGCADAARSTRAQISGLLFLASGLGLLEDGEKDAYEEESFRRCYSVYHHEDGTREVAL